MNETEYSFLVTRASEYREVAETIPSTNTSAPTPVRHPKMLPKRNAVYNKCRDHCPITRASKKTDVWTDLNSQCSSCIKYEIREEFRSGILPRQKEILEYLLTIKMKLTGKHVDNSREVAMDLKLQWVYCNVYPLTVNAIKEKIDSIFDEYTYLMKVPNDKKKDTYWNRYSVFINNQTSICDIIADPKYIQIQQERWGVTMTDKEKMFYENERKYPPIGRSESFVDCQ